MSAATALAKATEAAATTAASALIEALRGFAAAYEARPALVAEQRGWNVTIALAAADTGATARVRLDDGRVAAVDGEAARAGDVVIRADEKVLRDVLALRRSPNEPYLFGELIVEGPEADFLRLDYVATVLGP